MTGATRRRPRGATPARAETSPRPSHRGHTRLSLTFPPVQFMLPIYGPTVYRDSLASAWLQQQWRGPPVSEQIGETREHSGGTCPVGCRAMTSPHNTTNGGASLPEGSPSVRDNSQRPRTARRGGGAGTPILWTSTRGFAVSTRLRTVFHLLSPGRYSSEEPHPACPSARE